MKTLMTFAVTVAMATAAHAADITLLANETRETPAVIYVKGRFENYPDEYRTFLTIATPIKKAVVFFDSPGGVMAVGLGIGETIRQKRFTTAVADMQTCTSACAVAWVSGTPRMMGPYARIGFHAPFDKKTLAEVPSITAIVRNYLGKAGIPDATIGHLLQPIGPRAAVWLTYGKAKDIGIDVMLLEFGADAQWYSLNPSKVPILHIPGANELDGIGARAKIGNAWPPPFVSLDEGTKDVMIRAVPVEKRFRVCTEAEMLAKWAREVAPQAERPSITFAGPRGYCD